MFGCLWCQCHCIELFLKGTLQGTNISPKNGILRLMSHYLGGGLKYFLFSPRKLGKISILTNIFQRGWFNHQLGIVFKGKSNPLKFLASIFEAFYFFDWRSLWT